MWKAQTKHISYFGGEEGLLVGMGDSLVHFEAVIRHMITKVHENGGCLVRIVDGANQLPVQVIKWSGIVRPT